MRFGTPLESAIRNRRVVALLIFCSVVAATAWLLARTIGFPPPASGPARFASAAAWTFRPGETHGEPALLIPLTGDWEYRWGDCPSAGNVGVPACASSDHTDGWKAFSFPATPPGGTTSDAYLWLRRRLPAEKVAVPSLRIEELFDAVQVFVDGKEIYSFGFSDSPLAGDLVGLHIFPLPAGSEGKFLTVRLFAPKHSFLGGALTHGPSLKGVTYGTLDLQLREMSETNSNRAAVGIIVAFIGMVLFLCWVVRPREFFFFGAGLFSAAIGLYLVTRTHFPALWGALPLEWRHFELLTLYSSAWFYCVFVQSILRRTPHAAVAFGWAVLFFGFLALSLLGIAAYAFHLFPMGALLLSFQVMVLVGVPYSIGLVAWEAWRGSWEARLLLGSFCCAAAAAMLDVLNSMMIVRVAEGRSVTHWGILVYVLSVLVLVLKRFLKVYRSQLRLSGILQKALDGTRELGGLHDRQEVLRVGVSLMCEEMACPVAGVRVYFPHGEDGELREVVTLTKGESGWREDDRVQAAFARVSEVRHDPYVMNGEIVVPLRQMERLLGVVAIPCAAMLDDARAKALSLLAQSLAMSLENAEAVRRLREADKERFEVERRFLVERVGIAADISDRLNSPLLVISNTVQILNEKISEVTSEQAVGLSADEKCSVIESAWRRHSHHLARGVSAIVALSTDLAKLRDRENGEQIESTEAMHRASGVNEG